MSVQAKICGLDRPAAVDAAVQGGAAFVGFVFYPPSPRNLSPARAKELTARVPSSVIKVGLFVDPSDAEIEAVLADNALDLLQLHGAETPERVRAIKARFGLRVMKAIKIAAAADVELAALYHGVADRLLFDALAPADRPGALPGGNALSFDWALLAGVRPPIPWMLAGGITAENVARAVATTHAPAIDVSSCVEDHPGVKNLDKIKVFLDAVRSAG
jgi:phosphoribosylanthranilate isomerase